MMGGLCPTFKRVTEYLNRLAYSRLAPHAGARSGYQSDSHRSTTFCFGSVQLPELKFKQKLANCLNFELKN